MAAEQFNNVRVNLGRDRMVSINELAAIIAEIAGTGEVEIEHVDGAMGVPGRNSDNLFLQGALGWVPEIFLEAGLQPTYEWIEERVKSAGLLG